MPRRRGSMQNRLAENVGADSCLFRRAKTRQGHAQANAKPAASVLFTGGIQGAYRGHTGGKAPAWEAIGRRKRVASRCFTPCMPPVCPLYSPCKQYARRWLGVGLCVALPGLCPPGQTRISTNILRQSVLH